jgi:hypothetical protein
MRLSCPVLLILCLFVFLNAGVAGVPQHALYVCDSNADRVMKLIDLNGSGDVEQEVAGEISLFFDDSSPGPDLSVPSHLAPGPGGILYLLDGGTLDAILALEDKNGDGDANDEGDVWIFYDDSGGGPQLGTPNTLIALPDGGFYLSDDGSAGRRILWIKDADGDGDALDADEARVVYDASALSVPVLEDVESLAYSPADGTLYAADTTLQAVVAFRDVTGDGDFLDAAELTPFFQSRDDLQLANIDSLVFLDGALYAGDRDSGRIVRLEDTNGDGDAEDAGESSIFLSDEASLRVSSVYDFTARPDGGFAVLDNSSDTVFTVVDLNGDGDALDDQEVLRWLIDDETTLSTPHGLAFLPVTDKPDQTPFARGDVNADGSVDLSDPIFGLGYLFLGNQISVCLDALDTDDSGNLDISDAIYVLTFLFQGGPPPPAPFPEAGLDPTEDSIHC